MGCSVTVGPTSAEGRPRLEDDETRGTLVEGFGGKGGGGRAGGGVPGERIECTDDCDALSRPLSAWRVVETNCLADARDGGLESSWRWKSLLLSATVLMVSMRVSWSRLCAAFEFALLTLPDAGADVTGLPVSEAGAVAGRPASILVKSSDFFLRPAQPKRDLAGAATGDVGVGAGVGASEGDAVSERAGEGLADCVLSAWPMVAVGQSVRS